METILIGVTVIFYDSNLYLIPSFKQLILLPLAAIYTITHTYIQTDVTLITMTLNQLLADGVNGP